MSQPESRSAVATPNRADGGFTMIELLVVIVILGVLAAVVVFAVGGITDRGAASAQAADKKTLEIAEEAYRAQNGQYLGEAGLVAAGFLRHGSELHDISVTPDSSDYTIVPAGSGGGGGGGGGGNGGISAQTIGAFDANVYNQGGSPVIVVFSHRADLNGSLASSIGTFPEEIIWFNDADLDTGPEAAQALASVAFDGVFNDATDSGWTAGSAAQELGGAVVDGWSFSGDVVGLLELAPTGSVTPGGTYTGKDVTRFGPFPEPGNIDVTFFPANAGDVADFNNSVPPQAIPGVTLHLMPIPTADPLSPTPTPPPTPGVVYGSEVQGLIDASGIDFSLFAPGGVADSLTLTLGPDGQFGSLQGWIDNWVATNVDVFNGLYVTGVGI